MWQAKPLSSLRICPLHSLRDSVMAYLDCESCSLHAERCLNTLASGSMTPSNSAFGKINTVQPQRVRTPIENMIGQHDISAGSELFTAYLGSYKDDNEADKVNGCFMSLHYPCTNTPPQQGESFYTFGHIDADALSWHKVGLHDIHYAPIDNSNGFWEFPSTSAKVNGHVVHLGASNTAIADTGTTLALVSDELCELIYRDIKGARYDQGVQGYVFPKTATAGQLPRIEVKVGDNLFYIHKEDLAFADAGDGYVYGGVQSRGDLPLDVFGDTFLKGIYAVCLLSPVLTCAIN